jgi:hypothetical protein
MLEGTWAAHGRCSCSRDHVDRSGVADVSIFIRQAYATAGAEVVAIGARTISGLKETVRLARSPFQVYPGH